MDITTTRLTEYMVLEFKETYRQWRSTAPLAVRWRDVLLDKGIQDFHISLKPRLATFGLDRVVNWNQEELINGWTVYIFITGKWSNDETSSEQRSFRQRFSF